MGSHEDVEATVGPDTDLVSRHADNAGIARLINLDFGPTVQPKFSQPVDVIQMSVDVADPRKLPGLKSLDRYKSVNHIRAQVGKVHSIKLRLILTIE
jgi:hypothetical protein